MKNVLLLGNGIDLSYNKMGIPWEKLLEKMTINNDLPEHSLLPFPLEVVLRTNNDVGKALKDIGKELFSSAEDEELREILATLLTMGFDDILTTNYDYTLEGTSFFPDKITDSRIRKITRHTSGTKRAESRYLLHTYNVANCNGIENRVWHIHGEARKTSSIVIGHYKYINLVSKWKEILKKREGGYKNFEHTQSTECWLDSFIMGNVFVLGFGFHFCELDLWWLLERKNREKSFPQGKVIFYTPEDKREVAKYALLRVYNVEVRHLGFQLALTENDEIFEEDQEFIKAEKEKIKQFNDKVYKDFYKEAIKDINYQMKGKNQIFK